MCQVSVTSPIMFWPAVIENANCQKYLFLSLLKQLKMFADSFPF